MRLDLRLISLNPGLSRRRAQDSIWKGQVDVDGRVCTEPGTEVLETAKIAWDENRKSVRKIRTRLRILHEDSDLLLVSKPAGLLTVPTDAGESDTLVSQVSDYVFHRDGRRGYVGVVHRLDRDTTGVLVFATSRKCEESLRELFIDHRIDRIYDALVVPAPRKDEDSVNAPISRQMIAGRRRVVPEGGPSAQEAITHWKVVNRYAAGAHLEVKLETGRQHQIRIHLSHAGHPVLGDPTYYKRGRSEPITVKRPMLHARRLGFVHPVTRTKLLVDEAPPADFVDAEQKLRFAAAIIVRGEPGADRASPTKRASDRSSSGSGGARKTQKPAGRPSRPSRRTRREGK